jgi:hypothetical protein
MCCECGGGCSDTDDGAADPYGDGCDGYVGHPDWCGNYDDSDFSSSDMCCSCGGGSTAEFEVGPNESPFEFAMSDTQGDGWYERLRSACALSQPSTPTPAPRPPPPPPPTVAGRGLWKKNLPFTLS